LLSLFLPIRRLEAKKFGFDFCVAEIPIFEFAEIEVETVEVPTEEVIAGTSSSVPVLNGVSGKLLLLFFMADDRVVTYGKKMMN